MSKLLCHDDFYYSLSCFPWRVIARFLCHFLSFLHGLSALHDPQQIFSRYENFLFIYSSILGIECSANVTNLKKSFLQPYLLLNALSLDYIGFFFFFLMWTILKVFIEFDTILLLFSMVWFLGHEACRILAPQPGIQPTLPALKADS